METAQYQPSPQPRVSVLVVDDEEAVAEVIAGMLEDIGCTVETCNSFGAAAARLAAGPLPHLVLSDVRMPGGKNGIDLARLVRQSYPHVLFAFMSGFPDANLEPFGYQLLSKPITPTLLAGLVARAAT